MNWLAPDSKFMRAWSNLIDGIWVNILMLVTSIPIITVGAALTAGHDACRRSIEGRAKASQPTTSAHSRLISSRPHCCGCRFWWC